MIGPKIRAVVKEADARLVALVLRLLSRQGSFGGVEAAQDGLSVGVVYRRRV